MGLLSAAAGITVHEPNKLESSSAVCRPRVRWNEVESFPQESTNLGRLGICAVWPQLASSWIRHWSPRPARHAALWRADWQRRHFALRLKPGSTRKSVWMAARPGMTWNGWKNATVQAPATPLTQSPSVTSRSRSLPLTCSRIRYVRFTKTGCSRVLFVRGRHRRETLQWPFARRTNMRVAQFLSTTPVIFNHFREGWWCRCLRCCHAVN